MKYIIKITETFIRDVIINAANSEDAENKAHDLCNDGIIDLTYEDFTDRQTRCIGKPGKTDLQILPQY